MNLVKQGEHKRLRSAGSVALKTEHWQWLRTYAVKEKRQLSEIIDQLVEERIERDRPRPGSREITDGLAEMMRFAAGRRKSR